MKLSPAVRVVAVLATLVLTYVALTLTTSAVQPSAPPDVPTLLDVRGAVTQPTNSCAPVPRSTTRKITIMGDSISTPYGASAPERSWPEMLKARGATHGWAVTALGQGGTQANSYLPGQPNFWITEQVRSALPDVVTLNFRTNEQLQGQTAAQLKTALLGLMDAIRATSPSTQFLLINPPMMWYHGFYTTTETQADFTAKMWEAGSERGACFVDMVPAFPVSAQDPRRAQFLPDDIHPNDAGHAIFFAAVYTSLLQSCP